MHGNSQSLSETPQAVQEKRCRAESEMLSHPVQKRSRQSVQLLDERAESRSAASQRRNLPIGQLPSPALTGTSQQDHLDPRPRKRKAKSLDWDRPSKRSRPLSEPVHAPSPIDQWLARLPEIDEHDLLEKPETLDNMSHPPSKRSRSTDSLGGRLSQSGDGSDTVYSRDKKYSVYQNANYPVVLETKGSFMRPSKLGMVDEDRRLCEKLLTNLQNIPEDTLFDDDHFGAFHANLRGRSEARICADLHPRVMPSVENLCICGRGEFEGLIEGHNDPWIKSIPFHGPRPQPDHTLGFKWYNFSEEQRRKLNIEPTKKSYYTAREDIYFPFLTGEVKCGKQGLDLADRPNLHSMTIISRGLVDLYRRANRSDEVHRRVLGFSISHDDHGVRLYAHYAEIDDDKTTYWRDTLREFTFGDNKGRERWQCYQFTLNVCELFALPFLKRLKSVIDQLPDPATQSFGLTATLEEISVQSSQDDASATESQDEGFKRPAPVRGNAELRSMIQGLQRQLEQQRQDSERQRQEDAKRQREEDAKRQRQEDAERQRQDAKEREALLLLQLEQQRKESEQQRKESEQQRKESEQQRKELEQQQKDLMDMLKQQSAQINQLLQKGG